MTKTNVATPRTDLSKLDLGRPSPSAHEVSSADKGAPNLRREITGDGICILTFDRPNSSANIFDRATLAEVNAHVEYAASRPELKGLVLVSAKKSIFIAGADLNALATETNSEAMRALIEFGQTVFNRLAALPFPTVAAIHGACVGGGCEICLACDWRIASNDRSTRIGLPETQIGLIPAWGGSTRLPRLIGLPKALEIILAGKTLPGKPALKAGLVDSLVPREYLVQTALQKIREGKPHRPRHLLTNNAIVAAVIAPQVRKQLQKKTRGHYPAVFEALKAVTKGISRSVEESLRLEVEGILALGQSETTRNLIRLFFLQERAKKLKAAPAPGPATTDKSESATKRAAVIGAGVMGSGIAQWLSAKGIPVILRDINPEQVARGMANISKLYAEGAKRHTFTAVEARAGMDRVYPAAGEVPLHNVDLVIEAAVEDLALKKVVFQKLAAASGEHTVLATNTSALPISEIAAALPRPDQVVGIHFFNPVHRMQLVEVVRARQSSPATVQRAIQFVQQIGKLPVLVNDSPGFLVNRILIPYLIEAGLLFDAGAGVRDLDEAMLDFGMPMGPMRLLDEVGLDVANHICGSLAQKFPGRLRVPVVVEQMVKAGFIGRKAGRGFYVHSRDKKTELNVEADKFRVKTSTASLSREQLQERMVLLMINEAARCLEEQVVSSPEDVDFGMVMGTGFAPFRGGPLRYADSIGAPKLVAAMEHWSATGLNYFEPCASLKVMAGQNKTFYHDAKKIL